MPSSPSIVPEIDRDVCLVLDDFGPKLGTWLPGTFLVSS